ncbi:hypothetical protein BCR33DRAFT_717334 [Rhizoclosmatium globosum]|uniref:Uncharacterized protein n=1 Tax=Rhizoclosmatium globosum TaxID=329046 RepID=A0A1Y2C9M9_9FUNG|nr:hypothetical protein BCR33DRAFT_717334 [Rhizoclosmatium globosum]|eukprot:ORY43646.1 hypothetical protein BCR33DRAFT_717334 [Rhizoclosmatium globosum]
MDLLPRIAIPALVLFTLLSLSTIFILLPANHTQHNLTLPTTKPRIVVSLASFPGRIIRINNTIHSLASQSLKPDLILLSLPHNGTVVRFSKPLVASSEEIQLLKYLNDRFPGLFQVHETVDYGSATKLLGALEVDLARERRRYSDSNCR